MKLESAFEFTNAQELRRRMLSALETGRRNLTGAEYEQWEPTIRLKIREIDAAVDEFFVRMAFGPKETTSSVVYARYFSLATTMTRLQPTVVSDAITTTNLLTGVAPEAVAPCLPFPPWL
jgi:hypothetical protein